MAITISDKSKCSGCGACMNICSKHCIKMESDITGFLYPVIDYKNCIECGICEKICPMLNQEKQNRGKENPVKVYAGWSKDSERRYNSTSGGIFSELASMVLERGGVAAGAAYDQKCDVEHIIVSDLEGLEKIRQSKYVQSDIKTIYVQVKDFLQRGKEVLFCGAPCQTAGLLAFLGDKNYENLYLIDFICLGVNSPKAYRAWLDELEENVGSKIVKVWFKYKINGWKRSPYCTRIDFENGKSCVQNGYKNLYMRGYLGAKLYMRVSCGSCPYKGDNHFSDITLADFWGVANELDDDRGTSLILINTKQGQTLFEEIKPRIFCQERKFEELLEGNASFVSSVKMNPASEKFLSQLGSIPFSKMIEDYVKVSTLERVKYFIKRIVSKS
ncbi:MAG: 4Fe-4S dicluster domain-containing protein [Lachnospiraceae bacterium]|nr:4Fe-4S dicluster domain-containing protein [Lachnospiraceae bacterium]